MMPSKLTVQQISCFTATELEVNRDAIERTLRMHELRIAELEKALEPFASFAPDCCGAPLNQRTMAGAQLMAGQFINAYTTLYGKAPCK